MNSTISEKLFDKLHQRDEKIVLAESCTAGAVASALGLIPGISRHLCGSIVSYRAESKKKWLGVRRKTMKKFTTESIETASEMALGIMVKCPESNWGMAIVGHLGPDAPANKDGVIYISIIRRTAKGNLKFKYVNKINLEAKERSLRLKEAIDVSIQTLFNVIEENGSKKETTLSAV